MEYEIRINDMSLLLIKLQKCFGGNFSAEKLK